MTVKLNKLFSILHKFIGKKITLIVLSSDGASITISGELHKTDATQFAFVQNGGRVIIARIKAGAIFSWKGTHIEYVVKFMTGDRELSRYIISPKAKIEITETDSFESSTALTDSDSQRTPSQEQYDALVRRYDLLKQKLDQLQSTLILESDSSIKFQLEKEIEETGTDLFQVEEELKSLQQTKKFDNSPFESKHISSVLSKSDLSVSNQLINTIFTDSKRISVLSELSYLLSPKQFVHLDMVNADRSKIGFVSTKLKEISELIQDYYQITEQNDKSKKLLQLIIVLRKLKDSPLIRGEWYTENIRKSAEQWIQLVEQEVNLSGQTNLYHEIPNPFIYGSPINPRDSEVFVGRHDIINIIEHAIMQDPKPTLFLYGRRRTGKTSTLRNLNRFIEKLAVTIQIDMEDLRFRESSSAFCKNISKEISNALPQLAEQWQQQDFEHNPFTALHEFLDVVENFATERKIMILLAFDEYERLDTRHKDILDTLRAIIQHRREIVILVAGSHRFSEIKEVSWSDYLINTQTVEISYLDTESAYKLITNPVNGFDLKYPEDMPEEILNLTHCQPYLLQAVARELVDLLNFHRRKEAVFEDLETVKEKVLTRADAYFTNIWYDECNDDECQFLEALILADKNFVNFEPQNSITRSLLQKEILDQKNGTVHIAVPLFEKWLRERQLMIK